MNEQIERAVEILRQLSGPEDEELARLLALQGAAPALGARLVEFLPMGLLPSPLGGKRFIFPAVHYRRSPDGVRHQHELADDPVWNAILEFARKEVALGKKVDEKGRLRGEGPSIGLPRNSWRPGRLWRTSDSPQC